MKAKWINVLMLVAVFGLGSCLNDEEDPNAGLREEVKLIDQYLVDNPPLATDYVFKDDYSGVRFVIHEFGQGRVPKEGQTIKFNYEGRLFSTGALFDAGTYQNKFDDIPVTGLQYAISATPVGTSATIYVPSKLGYGAAGNSSVPANSILIYDYVLESISRTTAQSQQFISDTTAVHDYITTNEIEDSVKHPTGLWYKIEEAGTGEYPVPFDLVTIDYKMFTLAGTTPIDQGTLTARGILGLIDGLIIGIPLVNVGTKVTYYLPSELGYGAITNGPIPANSNLRFEMTLKSID
jgi:FKBP-type peptidyl-prolyl cis-trans isomerase